MTGKAAVFIGADKPLEIREYPLTSPGPGTTRLRLLRSGICGTDIHIAKGRLAVPPPFIPGHEFLGIVEAVGDEAGKTTSCRPLKEGDTAIACVASACGTCFNCRRDETASCLNFGVTYVKDPAEAPHFFGGFADYLYQPTNNLVPVPEGVDPDAAAAFPCAGPTIIRACAYGGGLDKDELVVVLGTGPVGLFAVAWAAAAGCRVIAVGSSSHPARLEMARLLGAETVWDYRAVPTDKRLDMVRARAAELGRGDGADVVIEASGAPSAVPEGLDLVRTRGRFLVPGQYSDSGKVEIAPQSITFKAISVIGSGQYTVADIGTYLSFLRENPSLQEKLASAVTHRFQVEQANEALAAVAAGRAVKAVFVS